MLKSFTIVMAALLPLVAPHTLVRFAPSGSGGANAPVAPGFAYAFRVPVPSPPADLAPGASNAIAKTIDARKAPYFIAPEELKTQYHSQDELGQYAYGYVHNDASHHEEKTFDGGVTGSYSYYDEAGVKQTARYVADHLGYRIEATNLPSDTRAPVAMTPEVAAATKAHLEAIQEAKDLKLSGFHIHVGIGDTPEVEAATTAHLKAIDDAKKLLSSDFRVQIGIGNTPDVERATRTHLRAVKEARKIAHAKPSLVKATPLAHQPKTGRITGLLPRPSFDRALPKTSFDVVVPQSVADTPEVAAAKAAHLKIFNELKRRHAARRGRLL